MPYKRGGVSGIQATWANFSLSGTNFAKFSKVGWTVSGNLGPQLCEPPANCIRPKGPTRRGGARGGLLVTVDCRQRAAKQLRSPLFFINPVNKIDIKNFFFYNSSIIVLMAQKEPYDALR